MIPVFIKRTNKIVTVSHSTLNDLVRLFSECENKSSCIHPGTDHLEKPTQTINKSKDNGPFILAVNSFEKRKNIPLILKIFSILKTKYNIPHQLYLVGQHNNQKESLDSLIGDLRLDDQVKIFIDVSSDTLNNFYQHASFFISTSQYEGFGFTPFEAIKSGLPAFLYKNPVCQEFFGDHPYIIENMEPEYWASLIHREMQEGFPNALKESALKELSWENTSKSFLDLLTRI